MKLSEEQIREVINRVATQGVMLPTLRDDLTDHLCCAIERRMDEGVSFDRAFADAVADLAPSGFAHIQDETNFLLSLSKSHPMKKATFFVGALCFLGMGTGCLLALMTLPMGHMIFGLAAFAFVIIFLPLDAVRYFKTSSDNLRDKLRYVFSTSSTIILATGIVSNLMLLPGANVMIIAGLILFIAGYLPLQLHRMFRESFSN